MVLRRAGSGTGVARGRDHAGCNAVDSNARCQLMRQRPRQPGQPRLGRDHMGALRGTCMRCEPADIDDGPSCGFLQQRQRSLRTEEARVN